MDQTNAPLDPLDAPALNAILREALAERGPDPHTAARTRAALLRQPATGPGPRRAPRRIRFGALPTRLSTGLAVGLVAAAAFAVLPGTTGDRGGEIGGTASAPDGRDVLLAAATVAAHDSAPGGRFWQTSTIQYSPPLQVVGGYRVTDRTLNSLWVSADGAERYSGRTPLGAGPAGPADEVAWRAAGSPDTFTVPADGEGGEARLGTRAGPLTVHQVPSTVPPLLPLGGCVLTPGQAAELPQDERGLEARLSSCAGTVTPGPTLRSSLVDLLTVWPTSPGTRAAGLRLLAGQGGVTDLGPTTDPLGRPGEKLSLANDPGTPPTVLVLDTTTGQVLSSQHKAVATGWAGAVVLGGRWTDAPTPGTNG
ncbi:CU044_5270 family protein [Kitasatospora sp. NPDC004289]